MSKLQANATAIVTVRIRGLGTWSDDCPMTQVYDQAASAAVGYLRNLAKDTLARMEIIGEPKVTAILTDRDLSTYKE